MGSWLSGRCSVATRAEARFQGGAPSSSISSEKLRNVRTRTTIPSVAALSIVCSTVMVRMMSAIIRISRPSRIARPMSWRSPRTPPSGCPAPSSHSARARPGNRLREQPLRALRSRGRLRSSSPQSGRTPKFNLYLPNRCRGANSRTPAADTPSANRIAIIMIHLRPGSTRRFDKPRSACLLGYRARRTVRRVTRFAGEGPTGPGPGRPGPGAIPGPGAPTPGVARLTARLAGDGPGPGPTLLITTIAHLLSGGFPICLLARATHAPSDRCRS